MKVALGRQLRLGTGGCSWPEALGISARSKQRTVRCGVSSAAFLSEVCTRGSERALEPRPSSGVRNAVIE